MTTAIYLNGELISNEATTTNISGAFSEAGIPLDSVSGEPERPGLSATVQYGALTLSGTTEAVTIDGDRVMVYYRILYELEVPGYGVIALSGGSEHTYTVAGPGCITLHTTLTCFTSQSLWKTSVTSA